MYWNVLDASYQHVYKQAGYAYTSVHYQFTANKVVTLQLSALIVNSTHPHIINTYREQHTHIYTDTYINRTW